MAFDGMGLGLAITGGVLLWSGIQNVTVQNVLESLARGTAPAKGPAETFATSATSGTAASTATAATGDTGAATTTAVEAQAIARVLAAPYGWSTGTEWADLVSLWNQESGWNHLADNASSGAYGIAQALPPTKYPPAGQASGGSSATAQISWGLSYIDATYGSPSAAWAHEESAGWY
jgi:resuscitation-promoting factor RpfB